MVVTKAELTSVDCEICGNIAFYGAGDLNCLDATCVDCYNSLEEGDSEN